MSGNIISTICYLYVALQNNKIKLRLPYRITNSNFNVESGKTQVPYYVVNNNNMCYKKQNFNYGQKKTTRRHVKK